MAAPRTSPSSRGACGPMSPCRPATLMCWRRRRLRLCAKQIRRNQRLPYLRRTCSANAGTSLRTQVMTVANSRFRGVVLRAALWLLDGKWSQVKGHAAERRAKSITAVAADILDRRARKIIKKTKRLQELDALHRHKLRIAVKKFRYGCEFFESLFEHAKARKRYERALKELQDSLGKLNDIEVHGRRGSRVANPRKRGRQQSQKAYAMGLLTGQEQAK